MSTTVHDRRWWQYLIPSYGNWGGPGYSAGVWNNDAATTDWTVPAVNAMDALFKIHDWKYQREYDRDAADRDLVDKLWDVRVDGWYGNLYRIGAIVIFTIWPFIRFF